MITVETTRFGKIDIVEPRIVKMKEGGILGFGHLKEFVLLIPDEKKPFWWLQSLEDGGIAFLVTDPFKLFADYDPHLSAKDMEDLHIDDMKDVAMLSIVTVHKGDQMKITANLRAPIVVNTRGMIARQMILDRDNYDIRYEIQMVRQNMHQDSAEKIQAASVG